VWFPALTPDTIISDVPGWIQLTITPMPGSPLAYGDVAFTTAARFPGNPSSLRLQSSTDGFVGTLHTIDLSAEEDAVVALLTAPSDAPFSLRWEAHNDFGDNGGGESGFATNDAVVRELVP
jgi:hypothetical protein